MVKISKKIAVFTIGLLYFLAPAPQAVAKKVKLNQDGIVLNAGGASGNLERDTVDNDDARESFFPGRPKVSLSLISHGVLKPEHRLT